MNKANHGRYKKRANILKTRNKPVCCTCLLLAHQIRHRTVHEHVVNREAESKENPWVDTRRALRAARHREEYEERGQCYEALHYYHGLPLAVLVDEEAEWYE